MYSQNCNLDSILEGHFDVKTKSLLDNRIVCETLKNHRFYSQM